MASAHRNVISARVVDIAVRDNRRELNEAAVGELAKSIAAIGLQTPITARIDPDEQDYILVAGRHRLEAVKSLGHDRIDCQLVEWTEDQARLWEISENLHRAELTVQQRADQITEWVKLTDRVSAQVAPKLGRPESGFNKAARELGIDRTEIQRAAKIASISDEAKDAARQAGLDDNQSALLRVAKVEPENQVAAVQQIAEARRTRQPIIAADPLDDYESQERQVARLMTAWNSASPEARQEFLLRVERPVFDRGAA